MILQEFKRCWKSKLNLVMPIMMAYFVVLSVSDTLYSRWEQYQNIIEGRMLGYDYSDALRSYEGVQGVLHLIEELFFLHVYDIFMMMIIFLIGAGIIVAGKMYTALKNGSGANMMTRMSYKTYLKNNLIAYSLYIVTFLSAFFALTFIGMWIFEGGGLTIPTFTRVTWYGWGDIRRLHYLMIFFIIIVFIILCQVLLILVASLSYVFIRNVYAIQFLPVAFGVGVTVFGAVFGNMSTQLAFVARALIFSDALRHITRIFSRGSRGSWGFPIFYVLFLLGIGAILYYFNVKKLGKDYI